MPDLAGVEHRFLDIGFLRMHVAEAGPPDGDPVVLLHGWPQHWYMWRNQIGPLAERYRVIVPDLRGLGWTEAPPWGYEKQQLAADVLALLDALGLERVKLAGHDWGGLVGFLLCLRRPERVERYVALNTGGPWADVSAAELSSAWSFAYQPLLATPWLGRVFGAFLARAAPRLSRLMIERTDAWTDDDARSFFGQFAERERAYAAQLYYRTFLLREVPRILRGRFDDERFSTPTLMLHGTADPVLRPQVVRAFERHGDDVRFELVEGAGHFVAEDAPDLVTRRMIEFFAATDSASEQAAEEAAA